MNDGDGVEAHATIAHAVHGFSVDFGVLTESGFEPDPLA